MANKETTNQTKRVTWLLQCCFQGHEAHSLIFLLSFLPWFLAVGVTQNTNLEVKLSNYLLPLWQPQAHHLLCIPLTLYKAFVFLSSALISADACDNNCHQLQFHHLVMVFAQLPVSHPKGLLQQGISDMLLKVLICYHLHALIQLFCLSQALLLPACSPLSNWDLSFFCGKQFCLLHQISGRTAAPAHLRQCSALVRVQLL